MTLTLLKKLDRVTSPDALIIAMTREELKKILTNTGWEAKRFIDGNDGQYIMLLGKH